MAQKKGPYRVQATLTGYYNLAHITEGKKFHIKHAKDFSPTWMKSLDPKLEGDIAEFKKQKPSHKAVARPEVINAVLPVVATPQKEEEEPKFYDDENQSGVDDSNEGLADHSASDVL
jgi:hypothetical protein